MAKTPRTNVKELKTEIDLLHEIIETIGATSELGNLLQQIARALVRHLKSDSCLIYLMEHSSHDLVLSGAWPPHPCQVGKLQLSRGEGLTGWVATHKKLVAISRNAYKDPRFKQFQNLPEDNYEAFLSVPIILGNMPIGVINIQNRRTRNYSPGLIKLLSSIARQVSGAIEKAKLLELAERKARQLETIARLANSIVSTAYFQEILQLIVTMTAQMMGSKICSLMLLDENKQELRIVATQSLSEAYRKKAPIRIGQSVSGRAIQDRKPIAVLDVTREQGYHYPDIARQEGLRSMLAVPMLIKDRPIGVINCYTTEEHDFSKEEIDVLQTIADQSAIAIENTRLIEESQSAKDALETRKLVERAKGMLMREKHLNEEEAFQFIQKQAMNLRRTMREIAEAILLTEGLKGASSVK